MYSYLKLLFRKESDFMQITRAGILSILFIAVVSCGEKDSGLFYETSFESKNDLKAWKNVNESQRINKAAPGAGEYSMAVGAGCIQPAAVFEKQVVASGFYRLRMWARMEENSASNALFSLTASDSENPSRIDLSVESGEWKLYESEEFEMRDGENLKLEVFCGGIAFSQVNIDGLQILQVR